eukprot:10601576-Karenia_brevis.AAC.1
MTSGKTATQRQPRRGLNEVVPEFRGVIQVPTDSLNNERPGSVVMLNGAPAKVLGRLEDNGALVNGPKTTSVGLQWTKDEFAMEAA